MEGAFFSRPDAFLSRRNTVGALIVGVGRARVCDGGEINGAIVREWN
jgi:hypothetical protein